MKTKISGQQFQQMLAYQSEYSNYEIESKGLVTGKFSNGLTFKNCDFNDKLQFDKLQSESVIDFVDCNFLKGVSLNDCRIDVLEFANSKFGKPLVLSNLVVGTLDFNECEGEKLIFRNSISNSDVYNFTIELNDCNFKIFEIEDANINKPIDFIKCNLDQLIINSSIINGMITSGEDGSQGIKTRELKVWSTSFNSCMYLTTGEVTELTLFDKVIFNEQLVINGEFKQNSVHLSEIRANYNVNYVINPEVKSIYLTDCNFESSLHLNNKVSDKKSDFGLYFYGTVHGNYYLSNLNLNSINLSCINFGNIIIDRACVNSIWFNELINYSSILLKGVSLKGNFTYLVLFDSILNKVEFENIDFTKFDDVVIAKSEVSKTLFINCIPPLKFGIKTKVPLIGVEISKEEMIDENMYYREIYRQLKQAMENQGNRYHSLYYKAMELNHHRREIKWGAEKLLLLLNYVSNQYGINWFRGLLFTLCLYTIFFIGYNSSLEVPFFEFKWDFTINESIETFCSTILPFLRYIASYPNLQLEDKVIVTWHGGMVLILARIFISYGIYQTIVAFRKYSSK